MLVQFVEMNKRLSHESDKMARSVFGRRDGNYAFTSTILPRLFSKDARVLDVGGGKHPNTPLDLKARLNLHVTGLDISVAELEGAPPGAYEDIIVGDVAKVELPENHYDLVFSCALLEHVVDVPGALKNLARATRPGGVMAHFIPCGNAPFARLNRLLGNEQAKRILFRLLPEARGTQGFPAYYHHCSPGEMRRILGDLRLEIDDLVSYYASGYASFFFPLHLAEIAAQVTAMKVQSQGLCESFVVIAKKPRGSDGRS